MSTNFEEITKNLNQARSLGSVVSSIDSTVFLSARKIIRRSETLDLHGKSLNEAKQYVRDLINKAKIENICFLKIITGRGNHINRDGTRGLIFKMLPSWLGSDDIWPFIESVDQNIGSYQITLKFIPENALVAGKMDHSIKVQSHIPSNKVKKIKDLEESEFTLIIKQLMPIEDKINKLTSLLAVDRYHLTKTDSSGITTLMIAAAHNEIQVMDFLLAQENRLFINRKLLQQKTHKGTTVLMAAVARGHIMSVDYLLKKAPSLLKQRDRNGGSVFKVARALKYPQEMLECLHKHLKAHNRERGYTGLFSEYEYKLITQKKSQGKGSKHSIRHMGRMLDFTGKFRGSKKNIGPLIKKAKPRNKNKFYNSKNSENQKCFKHAIDHSTRYNFRLIKTIKHVRSPFYACPNVQLKISEQKAPVPNQLLWGFKSLAGNNMQNKTISFNNNVSKIYKPAEKTENNSKQMVTKTNNLKKVNRQAKKPRKGRH